MPVQREDRHRPPLDPFQGQQLGSLEKGGGRGRASVAVLVPATMGAAGEGSEDHSAAALPALLKTSLRLREDLTAPWLPLQTHGTVAALQ